MSTDGYSVGPIRFDSVSAITATRGANDPKPGEECIVAGDRYVYVFNAGGSTIAKGNCAAVSALTGMSVSVSTVTSVDYPVGVCVHTDIPTLNYGWLLTKGICRVIMQADNSAAAGQLLTVAADGLFALKSNSTGYPAPALGKTLSAVASAGSCHAYISIY
jgi:hypothetical protein